MVHWPELKRRKAELHGKIWWFQYSHFRYIKRATQLEAIFQYIIFYIVDYTSVQEFCFQGLIQYILPLISHNKEYPACLGAH